MISVIAQERLLGATLGSLFVGGVVFEQRRGIYRSISPPNKSLQTAQYVPKDLFGKNLYSDIAHVWNTAVDGTLGNLVAYLSSRRW